jgi:hypothetical protein
MLPARIAAHYRDADAVEAVDMNVRRLLQQHAGIFEMLHDIEEQMDYGMMDTTQLAEDGKTVIENDETMGVLQWTVNSAYRVTVEALSDAHATHMETLDEQPARMHKRDGLEWEMSAESQAIHEEMVAVSRYYESRGEHVPR